PLADASPRTDETAHRYLHFQRFSLCEAGVGTGKTLAYLVGCNLWQMHRPERMKLPIVISTSSVFPCA
ncbi:UNVERIFIED_CONTAM: hypothetical protein NY603_42305, partial [Bacteroidetes bacterium 56_B9]